MRITPLLACVLVLAAGCRDDGTGPSENRVASIRLSQTAAPLDDGATLQLTAEPLDRGGRALPAGTVRLAWSSSDEAIATVADGLVTGRRPGEAKITATAGQASASAQVTVRPVPQALGAASGAAQEGIAGMAAPQEIAALLTDRHGGGVAGVPIEFVVVKGGGTVTPATAQTDAQGRARAAWTFGKAAGENVVEARVAGRSMAPALFAAMAKAGPPARLEKVAGDEQQSAAASQLPLPLVVRVVDANGNHVAGASVAWRCTSGGSHAPDVSVTDVAGEARATWLLGPGTGEQAIEARVVGSDAAPVQFSANAGVGAAARLEKVSGDNQEATVTHPLPEPLVVRVVDAPGNPLPGVKVSWKLFYGGGTVAPPESTTDAQGYARATWTLGTIMAHHRLEVRVAETAIPPVIFTALARVGAASELAKHGGNGQESEVGYTLPTPLVVRVTDAHGNPVPGVPVAWYGMGTMKSAETSTDTLGLARGTWVLATKTGPQRMTVSAVGDTVSFAATATPGPSTYVVVGPNFVLRAGGTRQLEAIVWDWYNNTSDGTKRGLTWSSSDPAVATVSATGLVTPVGRGIATITATVDGKRGSARVTVPPSVASITNLGALLGGEVSEATAINSSGEVVGVHHARGSSLYHGVLWRNGKVIELGTLGARHSRPTGINDAGQIVGSSMPIDTAWHAFLWQDGVMTDLHVLGKLRKPQSFAHAINAAGHVVGVNTYVAPDSESVILWKDGVATVLESMGSWEWPVAINNAGQIVGNTRFSGEYEHAFLWTNGYLTDLGTLGGRRSSAKAINAVGQVVGHSETGTGATHAFIWKDGVMTDLGTWGGRTVYAMGINDVGEVVGGFETSTGAMHAFIWRDGVMTDLGTLDGDSGSMANAINNAGQVVGVSDGRAVVWTIR